jgi:hypothetical protein
MPISSEYFIKLAHRHFQRKPIMILLNRAKK